MHSIRIVAASLAVLCVVSTEVQAAGRSAGETAGLAGATGAIRSHGSMNLATRIASGRSFLPIRTPAP